MAAKYEPLSGRHNSFDRSAAQWKLSCVGKTRGGFHSKQTLEKRRKTWNKNRTRLRAFTHKDPLVYGTEGGYIYIYIYVRSQTKKTSALRFPSETTLPELPEHQKTYFLSILRTVPSPPTVGSGVVGSTSRGQILSTNLSPCIHSVVTSLRRQK